MNASPNLRSLHSLALTLAVALTLALAACSPRDTARSTTPPTNAPARLSLDPLALVLSPHRGEGRIDLRIREHQGLVRSNIQAEVALDQLGWLFVAKARESFDAGFYLLAEQCGVALEQRRPGTAAALLLRGHALHSQHRFAQAESLARQLVSTRGMAADYGLLGDILTDLGRVEEAGQAYQTMLDLKPDPRGYARSAHLRWLKGDLEGAIEMSRMAAAGSSPRDSESAVWMHTQLARHLWLARRASEADASIAAALAFREDYAPGLLLRGRMLMSAGKLADAVPVLETAARVNPLPEYQWALSEALRTVGRVEEAQRLEREVQTRGPANDARGCALFLSTRREEVPLALRLAREELAERGDVFSHDAVAWALAASGDYTNAAVHMRSALQLGTPDPRLWLHAGVIALHNGQHADAERWLRRAEESRECLLPAELRHLEEATARLGDATLHAAR